MDYLDIELMNYQRDEDYQCHVCGEFVSDPEEWTCGCCLECENEQCNCDEESEYEAEEVK